MSSDNPTHTDHGLELYSRCHTDTDGSDQRLSPQLVTHQPYQLQAGVTCYIKAESTQLVYHRRLLPFTINIDIVSV